MAGLVGSSFRGLALVDNGSFLLDKIPRWHGSHFNMLLSYSIFSAEFGPGGSFSLFVARRDTCMVGEFYDIIKGMR